MTATMPGLAQFKQMTRATWAAGDFPAIAKNELWPMGDRIVRRVGVGPGEEVLDVACGTGNAAIRAALAGGRVTGLDLTPELFDAGRQEAAAAGVEVAWVEGDAEELPFEDERFDVVLSTFGCMFAPRHDVTARELARVLRPGGRLALFNWTPDGAFGRSFKRMGRYLPPPPAFAAPPLLWGDEQHVRGLFADTGIDLVFDREVAPSSLSRFGSVDERIDYYTASFGPLMMLRHMTEANGAWPELRDDLAELYARPDDDGEYLVVLGRKRDACEC
jgi:SAM-dependent methyltransferase